MAGKRKPKPGAADPPQEATFVQAEPEESESFIVPAEPVPQTALPQYRMSGEDLKAMLRQRRREHRMVEKGY